MSAPAPPAGGVDLVLVWHMHQPDYRDSATGEFREPWVYLHATKDYADMAAHLERASGMRAVVNFVPILLDQLDDYAGQFAARRFRDPLIRLLAKRDDERWTDDERAYALRQCFEGQQHLVARYPAFAKLQAIATGAGACARYLSDAFFRDLVTFYHLVWTGETVRRASPFVVAMLAQAGGFDERSRRDLLDLVGATIADLVPRYRRLEARGTIEISTSPAWHPLAPLVIDFQSAHDARPNDPLPDAPRYPGGVERVGVHIAHALERHAHRFGRAPDGLWPPEGGVSDAFVRTVGTHPLRWIASGSRVLANSLRRAGVNAAADTASTHRAFTLPDVAPRVLCFFRDDRLSDLIGFEYRDWHSGEAAAHFVAQLEAIGASAPSGRRPLVSVICDGENAWEYYPYNGYYFLAELYERIARHALVRPRTCRDVVAAHDAALATGTPPATGTLPGLVAGSWVYGDFSTWIGSADKNRAWDLLVDAKRACDDAVAANRVPTDSLDMLSRQLAVCEGSDWFWWFGDVNPAPAVARFDRLYRANLRRLYDIIGVPAPAALDAPVSVGRADAVTEGAIRRAS